MKKIIFLISLLALSAAIGCSNAKVANLNADLFRQNYKSKGVIQKVDTEAGTVTIDHEEIPGYMSPMQMTKPVADKAMLGQVKEGDKVEFEILRDGSAVTFTSFTKIGEVPLNDGATLYLANCAECHGAKGEGAKKGIPLISGHALAHSEEEYVQQVVNGKANKMPTFRDKFSDEQIAAIVKYVRTVIQADVKPEQREHHH